MKVFVTTVEQRDLAWNGDALSLSALANKAEPHQHDLTDSPREADVILITDLRQDDKSMRLLRRNPILREFPDKCFVLSRLDHPIGFARGVYDSIPKSFVGFGRFRAGFYVYESDQWRNPFIAEMAESPCEPDLFFSFIGRKSAECRRHLLAAEWSREDIVVYDPSYDHWDHSTANREFRQWQYALITRRSHFVICPRGANTASERLFEVMELGRVPVIVSDHYEAPLGPRWDDFSIRVAEHDVGNLESILEPFESRADQMGVRARQEWLKWFSPPKQFNYIVDACIDIQRKAKVPEQYMRLLWPLFLARDRLRGRGPRTLAVRVIKGLRSAIPSSP